MDEDQLARRDLLVSLAYCMATCNSLERLLSMPMHHHLYYTTIRPTQAPMLHESQRRAQATLHLQAALRAALMSKGCFASRAGSGQSGYKRAYGMRGGFKAIYQGQLGNPGTRP
jgi:hypothetical protein